MSEEVVVVVAGGAPPEPEAALSVPLGATVIAANGGLEHALALGLGVTEAVGDFDSAAEEAVATAESAGVRLRRHPRAKEATDLELALEAALERSPARILVLAGIGERLDHLLGAVLLLAGDRWQGVEIDAFVGTALVHVVRGERTLAGRDGEPVSLLPVHGAAHGVATDGLVYPLRGETLAAGSSRGVSNVFAGPTARVSLERGLLLAVRPSALETRP